MIINSQPLHIERGPNQIAERKFSIRASGKAFKILSDGLYSNKILAVIREYFCNAYDAHVAAGRTDKPIEVHFPNNLEPYFGVKDYGTGMSDKDILTIYNTYFESTKNNNNKEMGGLGIGGKAFFCYTDSFMVISRFNGVKRTYTAFYDEDGCPTIAPMGAEPTDEPNGLEVQGGIIPSDFQSFQSNAKEFFSRVSPLPEFKGVANFMPNAIQWGTLQGTNWKHRRAGGRLMAVMGAVAYPITPDFSLFSPEQQQILGLSLDITCGIGQLEVAASREMISFNKQSIENLKVILDKIRDEIIVQVNEKFKDCKNMWEARLLLRELKFGEYSSFTSLIDVVGVKWKGQKIELGHIKLSPQTGVNNIQRFFCAGWKMRRSWTKEIEVDKATKFIINDLKTGAISRIRKHLHDNGSKETIYVIWDNEPAIISQIIKECGMEGADFAYTSSLPKPPRGASTVSDKGKAQVLTFDLSSGYGADAWDIVEEDFDIEEGGIYAPLSRYDIFDQTPNDYRNQYIDGLETIGIDLSSIEVFGFKRKLIDKIEKNPKWIRADIFFKEQVAKCLANPLIAGRLADYDQVKKYESQEFWMEDVNKIAPLFLKGLNDKIGLMTDNYKLLDDPDIWRKVASNYGIPILASSPSFDLAGDIEDLQAKHPLLKMMIWAKSKWGTEDIFKQYKVQILDYLGYKPEVPAASQEIEHDDLEFA